MPSKKNEYLLIITDSILEDTSAPLLFFIYKSAGPRRRRK